MKQGWLFAGASLVILCALVDQIVKTLVVETMDYGEIIELVPFFSLLHTRNTGIAFSFLSGFSDRVMVVFTAIVMLFICWLALRTEEHQRLARFGFVLIVGGALGNIIDRASLGYVIDYFYFHTPVWSFAVFNLADVFITVGAILVIAQELVDWRRGKQSAG